MELCPRKERSLPIYVEAAAEFAIALDLESVYQMEAEDCNRVYQ